MLSSSRNPQTDIIRNIEVPSGKGLFIPVMSIVVSESQTSSNLIEIANKHQSSLLIWPSSAQVRLILDGNHTTLYYLTAASIGFFPVMFPSPEDAIFNISNSGQCNAVATGRYVWTHPLSSGNHTVHFRGRLLCTTPPDCIDVQYMEAVTYNITVKK